MIGGVGSAVGSGPVAAGGGVVARPRLFERLGGPARVTVVSAAAGSGKTVLLRSWIGQAGLAERTAWVTAGRGEGDPQRFWLSVTGALRQTAAGSGLVRPVTAAPELDGGVIAERLLADLARLDDRVWLVVDDVHELGTDALRQLEMLVLRAPAGLRFVLAARRDVRLGLHRLRLEGELAEIREPDLRFTLAEARELLAAAGVELPEVGLLVERTEGWAAGLRLAALSLAGHPDPARFAAEFSGSERTVAEYLLAEVLDRQGERVRRLLLRTSILERVNGELADLLTGDQGGERVLHDLAAANAFTVSVDADRSWFRFHQLFAEMLRLELRRTAPGEVTGLHQAAADWLAARGYPVEAVRHAQAARDWGLAAALLAGHWPALHLDGRAATVHELLAGFPDEVRAADAELAAVAAADERAHGSLEAAERYLALAERASAQDARAGQAQLLLGMVRLLLARPRANLPAVTEEARKLQDIADVPDAARPALGEDLRALALVNLGSAEFWAGQIDQAEQNLELGVALARRIGRPYLEFTGLAYQAGIESFRSIGGTLERGVRAVELAQRHGWTDDPAAGFASAVVGRLLIWQGRFEEAEPWVQRAERVLRAEAEPAEGLGVRNIRGILELARGRDVDALAAFEAADRLAGRLAEPSTLVLPNRSLLVQTLVRLGDTERAEQVLAELDDQARNDGSMRISLAALRLAQHNPQEGIAALAPLLEGSTPGPWSGQPALSVPGVNFWGCVFVLEAIVRDALGDFPAAASALERALDLAEPHGALEIFLLIPAPGLLERHARQRTSHAALIAEILSLLAETQAGPHDGLSLPCRPGPLPPLSRPGPLLDPLSDSEMRVLRYLPTHLTKPEIACELYVSANTVKTHVSHVYQKLGTHGRAETVARARDLGLLAPSSHRGQATRPG
jgi:LuxR family transcriptional regulator, maltose regulon positive regulatory protein